MISTAATDLNYNFLNFQECSGTTETSPFTLVLSGGFCIVCKKRTQTQLAGYWTHPECARYVAQLVKQAETEIPLLKIQVLTSNREYLEGAICSLGYDQAKFDAIQKEVTEKAWILFKQRHPMPWLNCVSELKEKST